MSQTRQKTRADVLAERRARDQAELDLKPLSLVDQLEAMLEAVEALQPKLARATDVLLRAGQLVDV